MKKHFPARLAKIFLLTLTLVSSFWLTTSTTQAAAGGPCDPLPPATGTTTEITTSQISDLKNIILNASPGETFLLHDGTYLLPSDDYLLVQADGVTIRSYSGNRDAVIIDGQRNDGSTGRDLIAISASNVTIADLTIKNSYDHPIHVAPHWQNTTDITNTTIYNVHIIDPGQQGIKINAVDSHYADNGVVACSLIELSSAGRAFVWTRNGSCYTGGIDGHQARGWTIRDNTIQGFWCENGLSEHAIHFWTGSRDTLVERNTLIDNARGVGFGLNEDGSGRTYSDNPCPSASGGYIGHYGGIIRNNFVFASDTNLFASNDGMDCGICLWQTCGAQALHNTIAATDTIFSGIEWRFDRTVVTLTNNLTTDVLMDRGGSATLTTNLDRQPLTLFVDGNGGDLHLAESAAIAIDQGSNIEAGLCDDDIDAQTRPYNAKWDIGADEYESPLPSAVTDLAIPFADLNTGTLTVRLTWSPPTRAVTSSIHYSVAPITEANWNSAVRLTDNVLSSQGVYTGYVPYSSGTLYFALKSQNNAGEWSPISNNVYWPVNYVYLPISLKSY